MNGRAVITSNLSRVPSLLWTYRPADRATYRCSAGARAVPGREADEVNYTHPMSLQPSTRLGPYEIISALGAGGMGEVYRARDTKLGREVAIKVLPDAFAHDAERMARFEREAQVLASLNHPNIAAIYGLEESSDVRALVMELVEGPTLADRIAQGPLPLDEALGLAKQIAEGLEYAHERGIVHRDLKPANIKVTPDRTAKLLDFGLAKAVEEPVAVSNPSVSPTLTMQSTRAGIILGTAAYMAPEQARGAFVDKRADVWAFGVVLYEMLTGKQPFAGSTVSDTLAGVLKTDPDLGAIPASVRRLVGRCVEKNAKRRLRDIGEARIAIEETLAGALSEAPTPSGSSPRTRHAVLWPVLAAIFLVIAAVLAAVHFRGTPPPGRVVRYTIAPVEKSSVDTFALSPDAGYLAIAASVEGKRQLWLRPLDSLQTQALPGTEGARYPFWSPDSRYVGFFTETKLKKIAVTGGPAQTLCSAPDARGGAWNSDGVIVFAPTPAGGLQRVAASGGTPAQVTQTQAAHRFPTFLPDGRHFLFLLTNLEWGKSDNDGIYLGSLNSQETRRILPDASNVVYSPPGDGNRNGHLLFVRENTLMAQPFDPMSLKPAGELFPVAEHIPLVNVQGYSLVSVSDNGVLVFQSGQIGPQSRLTWFDRSGKQMGPVAALGTGFGPALSPDEKTVAVPRGDPERNAGDIWIHEFARGTDTRFTFHASRNGYPVWSPDGSRIVFSSDRGGKNPDLYLKDVNGARQEELLIQSPYNKIASDWSRDGRVLVYAELDPKTKADLWVLRIGPAGGDRKPIPFLRTEFNEWQGQFSPDGHWIAYTSDESGQWEVYVRPFPAAAPGKWKVSTAGGEQPRWRRDGKELYYMAPDRKLMAVSVKAVGERLIFEAGTPEPLFESHIPLRSSTNPRFHYAVTGDGKRFLVQTMVGESADLSITVVQNWLTGVKK